MIFFFVLMIIFLCFIYFEVCDFFFYLIDDFVDFVIQQQWFGDYEVIDGVFFLVFDVRVIDFYLLDGNLNFCGLKFIYIQIDKYFIVSIKQNFVRMFVFYFYILDQLIDLFIFNFCDYVIELFFGFGFLIGEFILNEVYNVDDFKFKMYFNSYI